MRELPAQDDNTRFDAASWALLGAALLTVVLSLALTLYRLSLPTDGRSIFDDPEPGLTRDYESTAVLVAVEGTPVEEIVWDAVALRPQRPANWTVGQTVRYTIREGEREFIQTVRLRRSSASLDTSGWGQWLGLPMLALQLLIGLFVFFRRPRSPATRLLFLYGLFPVAALITHSVTNGWNEIRLADYFYPAAFWPTLIFESLGTAFFPLLLHFFLIFPVAKLPMHRYPHLTLIALYGSTLIVAAIWNAGQPFAFLLGRFSGLILFIWMLLIFSSLALTLGHTLLTLRDPIGQAQMRWVAWGIALPGVNWLLLMLVSLAAFLAREIGVEDSLMQPLVERAVELLYGVLSFTALTFPIALAIALLRYRLFDIDTLLNRTLVYGALVGIIVGLYVLGVGSLSVLLQTQADLLTSVLALGLVAVFVQPLRRRLQRVMDWWLPLPPAPAVSGDGDEGESAGVPPSPWPSPQRGESERLPSPSGGALSASLQGGIAQAGGEVEISTTLRGLWLRAVRVIWVAVFAVLLATYITAIPVFYDQTIHFSNLAQVLPPGWPEAGWTVESTRAALAELNLSSGVYTTLIMAIGVPSALLLFATAVLIFWRRASDGMALFTSMALVMFGWAFYNMPSALEELVLNQSPAWAGPLRAIRSLMVVLFVINFYLFPSGHFAPGWMRWFATLVMPVFGLSMFFRWPVVAQVVLSVFILGSVGYTQLYRYRHVSSLEERQQTKWVVFGTMTGFTGIIVPSLIGVLFPSLTQPGATGMVFYLVSLVVWGIARLLFPLSFAIAILRYRLWDINIIINRTLVYGTLTIIIVGMYVLSVGSLSTLLQTQNNLAVSILALVIVAALVQPVRRRLQRGVDRLMPVQQVEQVAPSPQPSPLERGAGVRAKSPPRPCAAPGSPSPVSCGLHSPSWPWLPLSPTYL